MQAGASQALYFDDSVGSPHIPRAGIIVPVRRETVEQGDAEPDSTDHTPAAGKAPLYAPSLAGMDNGS